MIFNIRQKMSRFTIVFLAFLICCCPASGDDAESKAIIERFENTMGEFILAERRTHGNGMGSSATYFYNPDSRVHATLFVFDMNQLQLNSDAEKTEFSRAHKKVTTDFALQPGFAVKQFGLSKEKINGLDLYEGIYNARAPDQTELVTTMLVTKKGNKLLKVVVTCASAHLTQIRKELNGLLLHAVNQIAERGTKNK